MLQLRLRGAVQTQLKTIRQGNRGMPGTQTGCSRSRRCVVVVLYSRLELVAEHSTEGLLGSHDLHIVRQSVGERVTVIQVELRL